MTEFILRDGEIAFNDPETGMVTIMNINTALELRRKMSGEDKKMQEVKEAYIKKLQDVLAQLADLKAESEKREKDLNQVKATQFFKNLYDLYEDPLQNVMVWNGCHLIRVDNPHLCFNKCTVNDYHGLADALTDNRKVYFYVDTRGNIFTSAADVERYYKLPKNSVCSFFNGKQKSLITPSYGFIGLAKINKDTLFPEGAFAWDLTRLKPSMEYVEKKKAQVEVYTNAINEAEHSERRQDEAACSWK